MLPLIRKASVTQVYTFSGRKNYYRIPFPDNEDLRNIKLWGVQTYYAAFDTGKNLGILPYDLDNSIDVIKKSTFIKTFLTLYDINNVEFLKQAPYVIFQPIQNQTSGGGLNTKYEVDICERDNKVFTGQLLDLQNSYIEIIDNAIDGKFSIFTEFYYSRIDLDTQTKIN